MGIDAELQQLTCGTCLLIWPEQHRRALAASVDANCSDASRYTKIGLLRKLLRETSRERAEWILWLDADTLLEDMAFQLPMSAYDGKNFIAWGNADYLWAGDQFHGECASRNIVAESRDPDKAGWGTSVLWRVNVYPWLGVGLSCIQVWKHQLGTRIQWICWSKLTCRTRAIQCA